MHWYILVAPITIVQLGNLQGAPIGPKMSRMTAHIAYVLLGKALCGGTSQLASRQWQTKVNFMIASDAVFVVA